MTRPIRPKSHCTVPPPRDTTISRRESGTSDANSTGSSAGTPGITESVSHYEQPVVRVDLF